MHSDARLRNSILHARLAGRPTDEEASLWHGGPLYKAGNMRKAAKAARQAGRLADQAAGQAMLRGAAR